MTIRNRQGLSLLYDENDSSITFETDKFSQYAVAFDKPSKVWGWWFLLLLFPFGCLGYRYREYIQKLVKKMDKNPSKAVKK